MKERNFEDEYLRRTTRYERFVARKVLKDEYRRYPVNGFNIDKLEIEYAKEYHIDKYDVVNAYRDYASKRNNGYIYVVGDIDIKVCKIGFSKKPYKRMKDLQTGCYFELKMLRNFNGTLLQEHKLHKKYKKYKLHGEWFRLEGDLKRALKL